MVSVGERVGLLPDPQFDVVQIADGLTITRMSLFSRKMNTMTLHISAYDFTRWRRGECMVQDAFPHLSADEREFLMSGATPAEWADVFADNGDEEDPV
jgi:hypothetical protein